MKYIVSVKYSDYIFDNGDTAMNFAIMAKTHVIGDERVEISIKGDDEDD